MSRNIFVIVLWLFFITISAMFTSKLLRYFVNDSIKIFWVRFIAYIVSAVSSFSVCCFAFTKEIQFMFFLIGFVFVYLGSEILLEKKLSGSEESLSE